MSRSKWKGPFISKEFICLKKKNKEIKLFCKKSVITQKLLNTEVFIYNGKEFVALLINSNMIGCKIGEFINTRKKFNYKKS